MAVPASGSAPSAPCATSCPRQRARHARRLARMRLWWRWKPAKARASYPRGCACATSRATFASRCLVTARGPRSASKRPCSQPRLWASPPPARRVSWRSRASSWATAQRRWRTPGLATAPNSSRSSVAPCRRRHRSRRHSARRTGRDLGARAAATRSAREGVGDLHTLAQVSRRFECGAVDGPRPAGRRPRTETMADSPPKS
mmetsp:Transcript_9963/g.27362  ORF Transcript_9963/g.27362 Transcript_9963/m.27362 type:complete len:202 (+) Transcript_9963:669-1274(+)